MSERALLSGQARCATPIEAFDYELPADRIARHPAEPRDASRLLVLDRASGHRSHRTFRELGEWLRPGDLLVRNDTRVFPARLRGRRSTGGEMELLLLRCERTEANAEIWSCLARPGRHARKGDRVELPGGLCGTWLESRQADGTRHVHIRGPRPVIDVLEEVGEVPLPPYIGRRADPADRERYQTVYARSRGSVAAPTAGLHFTTGLLDQLQSMGVETASITLHVGPGTFLPVRSATAEGHEMAAETVEISSGAAEAINRARREARRIVAVGTTTVRALEGAPGDGAGLESFHGAVSLFIRPGYEFRRVDALITNFHLPRSTLLMLVSAFAGRSAIMEAYREAVDRGYRFYSYGDAMLVV